MSHHRHRRSLSIVVMTILAVGSLSSCGDDDGDAGSPAEGATGTTIAPTDLDQPDDADPPDEGTGSNSTLDIPHACDLLTGEEVEAVIGSATPEGEEDVAIDGESYSQCFWEPADGRQLIGVGVVATTARYDMHAENMPTQEDVAGLGDEAIAFPGISSETRGATGGRTISISVDGRTVTVSVRLDGETPVDAVVPLAEAALSRF